MTRLDGWQRLGVVLSVLWAVAVMLLAAYEYHVVSDGHGPVKFVVLRDVNSQREFGELSASEVREMGRDVLKKSRSGRAEAGDAENAKLLLAAEPKAVFRYFQLSLWIIVPIGCFWLFFVAVRWIAAGFRKS